jgi:GTP-binding protein HflX
VILADTVGFIARLPHGLVEAFKATLEETREADLLLHVSRRGERRSAMTTALEVQAVLEEIGAGERPVLEVYNKIDLLESSRASIATRRRARSAYGSAQNGVGLDLLAEALAERLGGDMLARGCRTRPGPVPPARRAV